MLEPREAHGFERGPDPARHLGAFHPHLLHREGDFVRDVGGKELRLEILEYHPHARRDLPYARTVQLAAADPDPPGKLAALELGHYTVEALGQCRFARARRSHHADHLTRRDLEREPAQRRTGA